MNYVMCTETVQNEYNVDFAILQDLNQFLITAKLLTIFTLCLRIIDV